MRTTVLQQPTTQETVAPETIIANLERENRAMKRLVDAVQRLSLARTLDDIMAVVRHAARELTGADGATFVLRDGDKCFYADEEAIAPLWKGQRFPMSTCVSGWTMLNRQVAVIEDIYADPTHSTRRLSTHFRKELSHGAYPARVAHWSDRELLG